MSFDQQSARIAPPEIVAFIEAVIGHNWEKEQTDYHEQDPDHRSGHVFGAMCAILGWLESPGELVQFHETLGSDADRHRYTLVRFYRRGEHTFRVRTQRDSYAEQSFAVAEVLTAAREWTEVVNNDPSNWHSSTSIYGDRGTTVHPEPGFDTLRRIADALAREATLIVPA
ncbi:hypothetical protein ADK67_14565 [Saccharothrix sp. NRRL B-16348]|uniref:hypothetical protein n=1 Tax=Saccharothrix sp. NRRL B-16348 TaxID=1415542 RepID=UPI0006AE1EDB|nr:hypothetical protein [Saccharothrix sp. NRRL B-16348]KOX27047.1 hypothetical protein ADK67_14565 [Saccharothrix sp. NRRL B-16348]